MPSRTGCRSGCGQSSSHSPATRLRSATGYDTCHVSAKIQSSRDTNVNIRPSKIPPPENYGSDVSSTKLYASEVMVGTDVKSSTTACRRTCAFSEDLIS